MKILATQRLLSERSNQEKITHYSQMLRRVKNRLHHLSHEKQPLTTQRHIAWALRLEKRIDKLRSRHRH